MQRARRGGEIVILFSLRKPLRPLRSGIRPRNLLFRGQVEVAVDVSPDGVNMVGAVMRVVVLDQERRSLDAVSVSSVALAVAQQGEVDVVLAAFVGARGKVADASSNPHSRREHDGNRGGSSSQRPPNHKV